MTSPDHALSEAVDIPGYGEALDQARILIPPYAEDSGGGVTHRVKADGGEHWYKAGKLHRDGDQPAIIYSDGTQGWYQKGLCHRDGDKPAIVYPCGILYWYRNGELHRDHGLPAVTRPDGTEEYWVDGKRVSNP